MCCSLALAGGSIAPFQCRCFAYKLAALLGGLSAGTRTRTTIAGTPARKAKHQVWEPSQPGTCCDQVALAKV
jgi:hypothetical protein